MSINIDPLQQKMEKLRIGNLPLWGKDYTTKMLVAPKVIYILVMIPVIISHVYRKQYKGLVKNVLRNGKKPRIGLRKWCTLKDAGGLAIPDLELYNAAFEMNKLSHSSVWNNPAVLVAKSLSVVQLAWEGSMENMESIQKQPLYVVSWTGRDFQYDG